MSSARGRTSCPLTAVRACFAASSRYWLLTLLALDSPSRVPMRGVRPLPKYLRMNSTPRVPITRYQSKSLGTVGSTERETLHTVFYLLSNQTLMAKSQGANGNATVHTVGDAQVQAYHNQVQRVRNRT